MGLQLPKRKPVILIITKVCSIGRWRNRGEQLLAVFQNNIGNSAGEEVSSRQNMATIRENSNNFGCNSAKKQKIYIAKNEKITYTNFAAILLLQAVFDMRSNENVDSVCS